MYCNQCGNNNEDGAKFCVSCGTQLQRQGPPAAPQTSPSATPPAAPANSSHANPSYANPSYMDDGESFQFHAAPKRGNGAGLAAFILAMVSIVAWIVGITLSASMFQSGLDEQDPEVMALGLFMLLAMLITLAGVVVGIVGCALQNRRKALAITGLVINSLILLFVILLMFLGATAG